MNKSANTLLWRFWLCLAAGLLAAVGGTASVMASDDIDIKEARWSRWSQRLYVEGEHAPDYSTVTIRYTGDGTLIGTTQADREGNWDDRFYNLDPPPCRVRAEAGGHSDERSVERAPSNCSNYGGGGNTDPVANTGGPYSGTVGIPVSFNGSGSDSDGQIVSYAWGFGDGGTGSGQSPSHTYTSTGTFTVTLTVTDDDGATGSDTTTATITEDTGGGGDGDPIARGDAYATPVGTRLDVAASRVSGVLYNDFDTDADGNPIPDSAGSLTAQLVSGTSNGSLSLNADGSFSYTPNGSLGDNDNDSFTYRARDAAGSLSAVTTVNINILSKQADFKIFMNYELGMHCTGFEFAYCCVLPPYNSILAQVVKPESGSGSGEHDSGRSFPRLLEGDPNNGLDGLGRETVVRDFERDGTFKKYYLEYYHDAQPRREGQGKPQEDAQGNPTDTLISAVEGNSLFYHQTIYDSAALEANGALKTGTYEGVDDVVVGDGDFDDATDNYANGWLNHFYVYADLEGTISGVCEAPVDNVDNKCVVDQNCNTAGICDVPDPDTGEDIACTGDSDCGSGQCTGFVDDGVCDRSVASSREQDKIRLGVTGHIEYPADVGAALQPMGPTGSAAGFDNVLTFSADTGTVVYTQMKVLENLPIMLTSPKIWEALGLPLTPFEDSIDFFGDPGLVDEDSIRPYVAMKARLHEANCNTRTGSCTQGPAVIGSNGHPVIGFGTAPIDIPNCERCHSVPPQDEEGNDNTNSPSYVRGDFAMPGTGPFAGASLEAVTDAEYQFWNAYYDIIPGTDSDWYSRLKGAAINMLSLHDFDQHTGFTSAWPSGATTEPYDPVAQNTRLGKESVICQKCHADNVIAVVKSATVGGTSTTIKPISEAIHWRHRETSEGGSIDFADATGRSGGCQGCHPAHRSDGVMDGYPITLGGDNEQANSDNRLAIGGCFVGRDVHSNPLKDVDGAETPEHLNAVGTWLATNVFHNQAGEGGVAGSDTRGLWCTNCHTQLGQEIWKAEDCNDLINGDCTNNVRGLGSLSEIATAIGSDLDTVKSWLDPKNNVNGNTTPDGMDHSHRIWDPAVDDALLATIEVDDNGPVVTFDGDGDPSVNILSFCTTDDCVAAINANKGDQSQWRYPANPFINTANSGVAVPFLAATDGRDHWLSPGEPHCADCHSAPYVEQSGNINAYPPFNYPAKASLMRYSKGHQGITCQGCHESIHGLYPVTPTIDSTSYAQAAALNHDGSHGPLKCGTCHDVDGNGLPTWLDDLEYKGERLKNASFDTSVTWAHTFTDEASVRNGVCRNCHGDEWSHVQDDEEEWLEHADKGRVSRAMMDKAEIEITGSVFGSTNPRYTVCRGCHGDEWNEVSCNDHEWREHLTRGRVSESVWEAVSEARTNSTCGW